MKTQPRPPTASDDLPEADKLRQLRREVGLSLAQAANLLRCSIVEASQLERGVSEPAPPHTWDDALQAYATRGAK